MGIFLSNAGNFSVQNSLTTQVSQAYVTTGFITELHSLNLALLDNSLLLNKATLSWNAFLHITFLSFVFPTRQWTKTSKGFHLLYVLLIYNLIIHIFLAFFLHLRYFVFIISPSCSARSFNCMNVSTGACLVLVVNSTLSAYAAHCFSLVDILLLKASFSVLYLSLC
jgi:hypothetical protein